MLPNDQNQEKWSFLPEKVEKMKFFARKMRV